MNNNAVLLLGTDTPIGLSIIRELGENGVKVIGLGSSKQSLGRYSRYIHQSFVREKTIPTLIEQLATLSRRFSADYLMAISENDIEILNQYRNQLQPLTLLIPPPEIMSRALNKNLTYEYAEKVGIKVPETLAITALSELETESVRARVKFPVVLKWANFQSIAAKAHDLNIQTTKAEYAYSHDELLAKLRAYEPLNEYPIIQNYCNGSGLGHFFFIHQGKVLQKFQHLRLHEYPPEGGFSSYCRALPLSRHADLLEKSERLLLDMEWEGVAMVEYRYDAKSGDAWLMEVNGRFWGSLPLAYHCGARFAWLLYQHAADNKVAEIVPARSDIRCRFMIPETKRLARVLFQKKKIEDQSFTPTPLRDLLHFGLMFLHPSMRYFVFSLRDPLPFFSDLYFGLTRALRR